MANINFSKFRYYVNNEDVEQKDVYLITDEAAQASITALDTRVTALEGGGGSGGDYLPLTGGTLANSTEYTLGLMPNQISFLNGATDGTIITYDSINFGDSTTTRSFSFETGEVSIKDTHGTGGFDTQGHAWLTSNDADVFSLTSPSSDHYNFSFYANAGSDPTFVIASAQTKVNGNFIIEGANTSTSIKNDLILKGNVTLPTSSWSGDALTFVHNGSTINAVVPGPTAWSSSAVFATAKQEALLQENGLLFSYNTEDTATSFGTTTYIGPSGIIGKKGQESAGLEYQPIIQGFNVYDKNGNEIISYSDTDTDWTTCNIAIGENAGSAVPAAKARIKNGVFYLTIDILSFSGDINAAETNYWIPILTIPAGSNTILASLQDSDSTFMGSLTGTYLDGADWKSFTCPIKYFKTAGQFRMNVAGTIWRDAASISVHESYGTLAIPL